MMQSFLRNFISYTLFFCIILTLSIFVAPLPTQAHSHLVTPTLDAVSNRLTVLILDMSGSMSTNDPQGYRCSAADAFIDLSGPGNYISVIGLDGTKDQNGNPVTGGSHNFGIAQQWTPNPVDMSVQSNRERGATNSFVEVPY